MFGLNLLSDFEEVLFNNSLSLALFNDKRDCNHNPWNDIEEYCDVVIFKAFIDYPHHSYIGLFELLDNFLINEATFTTFIQV